MSATHRPGAAAPSARASRGARPSRWASRGRDRRRPRGASRSASVAPRARARPARTARRRVRGARGSTSATPARPRQREQRVGDGGPGATRAEQHHPVDRAAGSPAPEGLLEARPVGVVPDLRPSSNTTVFTASSAAASGESSSRCRHDELLARMRDVDAGVARGRGRQQVADVAGARARRGRAAGTSPRGPAPASRSCRAGLSDGPIPAPIRPDEYPLAGGRATSSDVQGVTRPVRYPRPGRPAGGPGDTVSMRHRWPRLAVPEAVTAQRPSSQARSPSSTPRPASADILAVPPREFADQGYAGARIDEIADRTRTTKRMIYYYFGGKEQLYVAVLERAYERDPRGRAAARRRAPRPGRGDPRLAELTFDHHEAHPDFIRLVASRTSTAPSTSPPRGPRRPEQPRPGRDRRILDRGWRAGLFTDDVDAARRAHDDQRVLRLPDGQPAHVRRHLRPRPGRPGPPRALAADAGRHGRRLPAAADPGARYESSPCGAQRPRPDARGPRGPTGRRGHGTVTPLVSTFGRHGRTGHRRRAGTPHADRTGPEPTASGTTRLAAAGTPRRPIDRPPGASRRRPPSPAWSAAPRVLRLLHLRHRGRPGLRPGLLPGVRPGDRHAAVAGHVRRRLRGAARSARSSSATSATRSAARRSWSSRCC